MAVGATNKNLTYGEVYPLSIERHVLPAFSLPDSVFRERFLMPPSPGRSSLSSSPMASMRSSWESTEGFAARSSPGPEPGPITDQVRIDVLRAGALAAVSTSTCLRRTDVFYDLGSGTGKIPLQVALQCPGVICKGIEYAKQRNDEAQRVYDKLTKTPIEDLAAACAVHLGKAGFSTTFAMPLARKLQDAGSRLHAICGSFLDVDIDDATVIFVNNTVFEPPLMIPLVRMLSQLPNMRRLVVLRTLCARHGPRCIARDEPCAKFVHPPVPGECYPTWCPSTTIFTYAPLRALGLQYESPAQKTLDSYFRSASSSGKRTRSVLKDAGTVGGISLSPKRLFEGEEAHSPRKRPRRQEAPTGVRRSPTGPADEDLPVGHKMEAPVVNFSDEPDMPEASALSSASPPEAYTLGSPQKAATGSTPLHTPPRATPRTPARPPSGRRAAQSMTPPGPAAAALHKLTTMTDAEYEDAVAQGIATTRISSAAGGSGRGSFEGSGGIAFASPLRQKTQEAASAHHATPARPPRAVTGTVTPGHRATAEVLMKSPSTVKKNAQRPQASIPVTPARGLSAGLVQTPMQAKPAPTIPDSPFYTLRRTPKHPGQRREAPGTIDAAERFEESESSASETDAALLEARAKLGLPLPGLMSDPSAKR